MLNIDVNLGSRPGFGEFRKLAINTDRPCSIILSGHTRNFSLPIIEVLSWCSQLC